MLNVMQITSTLRGMSDQQLAQYAAMHKADPYIFPLAFQESQDRKSMRAGKLAQMTGQKPPPVVDQDLQQMMPTGIPMSAPNAPTGVPMQGPGSPAQSLPEDQGIGALPAKNLQGMKDGGITGQHFKDKGEVYKTISDEDISGITNAYKPFTAEELATERAKVLNPMNAEMETAYRPYVERLTKREQELAGRKEGNVGNALLAAGLRMMAGTSPYAFQNIGAGGIEGLQTYAAAQKSDQAAKDALDHSNMLLMQAQRAERSGNSRDATALLDAAQKQREAHVAHGLTGLQLKNTSQFQAGQLANTELQRQIEAGKAAEQQRHNKQLEELYYKPSGEAAKSRVVTPEDKITQQLDARINQATARSKEQLAKLLAKPYVNEKAVNNLISLHNQEIDSIYKAHPNIQEKYGYLPPYKAEQAAPEEKGLFEKLYSSNPTPAPATATKIAPELTAPNQLPPNINPAGIKFLGYENK